jgi:hypothetical protein
MNRDRRWLALPLILTATFMYGFGLNVVNVALPSLQRELHAGAAALELVAGGTSLRPVPAHTGRLAH